MSTLVLPIDNPLRLRRKYSIKYSPGPGTELGVPKRSEMKELIRKGMKLS